VVVFSGVRSVNERLGAEPDGTKKELHREDEAL